MVENVTTVLPSVPIVAGEEASRPYVEPRASVLLTLYCNIVQLQSECCIANVLQNVLPKNPQSGNDVENEALDEIEGLIAVLRPACLDSVKRAFLAP